MIGGMFRDALSWFAGLIESVSVVVAILIVGLVFGMAGFWILGRSLRKLGGPPAELDSPEYELNEDVAGQAVSTQRDEDSPPSEC
jgi:hypothetical protein